MNPPLLEIKNLFVSFKTDGAVSRAVNDISFTVSTGEIVAIVGESGSGKSVTSLSLMQLLPKQASSSGRILYNPINQQPVDLMMLNEKKMRAIRGNNIAMIFQEPMTSLNPVFTCGFQVAEAIQAHKKISAAMAKEKTITLFKKVKLPNPSQLFNRYPHQLSGGQKQRVMIAMAMSCNPQLLIADEPTTALDVTVQKDILNLVKELQTENGMSVLLITHDLGIVADIADKLVVMYKGEIIEQGNTADVLQQPSHPYTKALMACRPMGHRRGTKLPVVSDFFTEEITKGNEQQKISDLEQGNTEAPESKKINSISNIGPSILSDTNADKTDIVKSNKPTLEVQNLKVYFQGRQTFFGKKEAPYKAVDDVSFVVHKGETVGLVGESGCGKTTLGRAILQLIPLTSGNIILNGTNLAGFSQKMLQPLRKDLQIVFQDPYGSLNPRLTIGNAIQEPMKVHGILQSTKQRKEKVIEMLEKVNLQADFFNRYPYQFSGGQRQRICIARALVLNPSFLVFDESVSALDVSVQAQVLNLLNDLKKEYGFTAIFISHDLSVVRYISDRILVMKNGKIVEEGTADEIYYSPKNDYTKMLIEAIPGKTL